LKPVVVVRSTRFSSNSHIERNRPVGVALR
jgi:hypothetical protein